MRNEDGFDEDGLLEGEIELWRNEQWRVTTVALEEVGRRVLTPYWISLSAIHRDTWPEHMAEKRWISLSTFLGS